MSDQYDWLIDVLPSFLRCGQGYHKDWCVGNIPIHIQVLAASSSGMWTGIQQGPA